MGWKAESFFCSPEVDWIVNLVVFDWDMYGQSVTKKFSDTIIKLVLQNFNFLSFFDSAGTKLLWILYSAESKFEKF